MHISDLIHNRKGPFLSFEFFPPKDDQGMDALKQAAAQLLTAQPDFVTVTYGAGGSTRQRTLEVCDVLAGLGFKVIMPHLTCVGHSRAELTAIANDIHRRGYRNIMALRGDPPKGEKVFSAPKDGLAHASDLVRLIRELHPDMSCGVAGYPEKHPEAASLEEDIEHLRAKVDAGAGFVTTQLFFDNTFYYRFVQHCRNVGILAPIVPGIMPAVSYKQIERFVSTCGASVPRKLAEALQKAGTDAEAGAAIGIDWIVHQIDDLLKNGVSGIHLYVLNRTKVALAPAVVGCFKRYRG
ncbi:MAG TPA: methylenetetrahydrofolate reductase [NAD(P)H] [Kiritimatiellia bacterium]|nr:methylenetetrahydrofolate reductase [NAD(P)H] [Kiritimatiellia bacterium]